MRLKWYKIDSNDKWFNCWNCRKGARLTFSALYFSCKFFSDWPFHSWFNCIVIILVKAAFYSCKFLTSFFLLTLGHLSPRLWLFLCIFSSSVWYVVIKLYSCVQTPPSPQKKSRREIVSLPFLGEKASVRRLCPFWQQKNVFFFLLFTVKRTENSLTVKIVIPKF